jgi:hypothetical protein
MKKLFVLLILLLIALAIYFFVFDGKLPFGSSNQGSDVPMTPGELPSEENDEPSVPEPETPTESPVEPSGPASDAPASDEPTPSIPASLPESTQGLEYRLNADGQSYTVIGMGTAQTKDIVIGTHNGLPVTCVAENAFYGKTDLKSVTLGNCVTHIEDNAFGWCLNLTSVTLGDCLAVIGDGAFGRCAELPSITLPDTLESVHPYAFRYCNKLTHIYYEGTEERWWQVAQGQNMDNDTTKHFVICSDSTVVQ